MEVLEAGRRFIVFKGVYCNVCEIGKIKEKYYILSPYLLFIIPTVYP